MRKTVMLSLLVAAAVGLVAAGCGGDDDDTGGDGEAPSKEEFVTQADEICTEGDAEIEQAAEEEFGGGGEPSSSDQERFFTDTVLPNIQNQIDQIRELTPPEGDEEEVTSILEAAQGAIDEAEQDPSAIAGGEDPFAEANRLAGEYGLTDCGGG